MQRLKINQLKIGNKWNVARSTYTRAKCRNVKKTTIAIEATILFNKSGTHVFQLLTIKGQPCQMDTNRQSHLIDDAVERERDTLKKKTCRGLKIIWPNYLLYCSCRVSLFSIITPFESATIWNKRNAIWLWCAPSRARVFFYHPSSNETQTNALAFTMWISTDKDKKTHRTIFHNGFLWKIQCMQIAQNFDGWNKSLQHLNLIKITEIRCLFPSEFFLSIFQLRLSNSGIQLQTFLLFSGHLFADTIYSNRKNRKNSLFLLEKFHFCMTRCDYKGIRTWIWISTPKLFGVFPVKNPRLVTNW